MQQPSYYCARINIFDANKIWKFAGCLQGPSLLRGKAGSRFPVVHPVGFSDFSDASAGALSLSHDGACSSKRVLLSLFRTQLIKYSMKLCCFRY